MDSLERYLDQQPGQANPATLAVMIMSVALAWTALVGRAVPARRNPEKTQSALSGDSSQLEETTSLNGSTKVFRQPIILASNCIYRITGPGTLDADISGPTNSLLVLTNCVLINRTTQTYPKNGVRYQLDNGVYLNFINQKERPQRFRHFILPYDAAYNEVRFGGPMTLKVLNRLPPQRGKHGLDSPRIRIVVHLARSKYTLITLIRHAPCARGLREDKYFCENPLSASEVQLNDVLNSH